MSDEDSARDRKKGDGDPRVDGLVTVGWVTLAMLALSIPLGGMVEGWLAALIPLSIIFGSGLMAVRIWSSGERTVSNKANEKLRARIEDLESRLANLEMIDSVEEHFAARHRAPGEARSSSSSSSTTSSTMGPPADETSS